MRPELDLQRVDEAQQRFESVLARLDDAGARRPTHLPGWTVGHLLTHVARNADSHRRRIDGALRGETVEQYPGGFEGRTAEIDAGAGRSPEALLEDVRSSAAVLPGLWRGLPDAAWDYESPDVGGRWRPLSTLPGRRWQELEVHLVDLDLGPTQRDWSDDFVAVHLPLLRATLGDRLPSDVPAPAAGALGLDERDELAWLYGRLFPRRDDLPQLADWG